MNKNGNKKNILFVSSHKRLLQSFGRYFIEKYRDDCNITIIYGFDDDDDLMAQLKVNNKIKIKITSANPIIWYLGCIKLKKIIQQNNFDILVQNNYLWTYNKYIFKLAKNRKMECWFLNDSTQGKRSVLQYLVMQYNASSLYTFGLKYLILIFRLIRAWGKKAIEFIMQIALVGSIDVKKYHIDKIIYFSETDLRLLDSNGLKYSEKEKIIFQSNSKDVFNQYARKTRNALLLDSTGISFYKNQALLNERLKLFSEISKILNKYQIKLMLRPHPEYRDEFARIFNNNFVDGIVIDVSSENLIDVFQDYEIIIGGTSTALDEAAFIYGSDDQKLIISIDNLVPYEFRGICRHEKVKICNDLNQFSKCISSLCEN